MTSKSLIISSLPVMLFFTSCSASSAFTQSGGLGALFGGAAGAGIGAAVGDQHGEAQLGAAVGGAIGAGLGLLTGGIIHEQNEATAKQDEIVVRQAAAVSREQLEIDALRKQVNESSDWGGNETKPWEERYNGSNPNRPYQGPASSTFRN